MLLRQIIQNKRIFTSGKGMFLLIQQYVESLISALHYLSNFALLLGGGGSIQLSLILDHSRLQFANFLV